MKKFRVRHLLPGGFRFGKKTVKAETFDEAVKIFCETTKFTAEDIYCIEIAEKYMYQLSIEELEMAYTNYGYYAVIESGRLVDIQKE